MAVITNWSTGRFTAAPVATGFSAGTPSYDGIYYDDVAQDLSLPPVLFMAGGGTEVTPAMADSSGGGPLYLALAAAGFTVLHVGVPWLLGNAEALTRITDAVNYGVGTIGLDGSRPPVLIGISNGGICAMRWSRFNAAAGVCLITTPVDLQEMRDVQDYVEETLADLRGKVDAAWGVTYPAALPALANPYADRANYVGTRYQQWFSTDDIIGARWQEAFACYVDADMHSLGRYNHTVQAANAVDHAAVIDFIERCFAAA